MVATAQNSLWDRLGALWGRRETIRFLVVSQLRAGHRTKILGNLWNLLDPLFSMVVYFLVFGLLMSQGRGDVKGYLIYLFIGVLSWRFIDGALSQAVGCIRSNRGLVQEIRFPKAVFPLAICLSRFYDLLWGVVVLLIAMTIAGMTPGWSALWLVPLFALKFLLTLGAAYALAYLGAFLADTSNILTVVLRLGFYASPILYYADGPQARLPERFLSWYMLNPVACLLEGCRRALMEASAPDPAHTLHLALCAALLAVVGFGLFSRGEGQFAKYV